MFNIWLGVHMLGAAIGFFLLVSLVNIRTHRKSNLMLAIACTIFTMISRCLYIDATTLEQKMAFNKMEYTGKSFVCFLVILFVLEFRNIVWPVWLKHLFFSINIVLFVIVATCDHHKLYYASYKLDGEDIVTVKTPIYYFYMVFQLLEMLIFLYYTLKPLFDRNLDIKERKMYVTLSLAAIVPLVFVGAKTLGVYDGHDLAAVGIEISDIFMFFAVKRFGLFDLVENAKSNMLDNLGVGMLIVNRQKQLQYANKRANEIVVELASENSVLRDEKINYLMEHSGEIIKIDNRRFEINVSEVQDDDNGEILEEYSGYIVSIVDVTELVKHAKEMSELKEKAETANRAKSDFLSNMSHEIRSPMNVIIGMTEIILRGELLQEQRDKLLKIQNSSKALLTIINDILDFSKIESGKLEIVNEKYDFKALSNEFEYIFNGKNKNENLIFKQEIDSNIPKWLVGDNVRIKQIVQNFIDNAIKFTENGYVKIKIEIVKQVEKQIYLQYTIEDTGQGIKKEDYDKLFKVFSQVDTKRNHKKGGSGLGLSISKNLIELMGGSIEFYSEYGKGTSFVFTVPQIISDKQDESENTAKEQYFKAPDAKVLVVDDNELNLEIAFELLKPLEMNIELAHSGKEAIECVKAKKYDIVFMDHMMPEMDGVETTRIIRKLDDYNSRVPIVALTADAVQGTREYMISEGMNDFVSKPIDMDKLCAVIKQWLPEELVHL